MKAASHITSADAYLDSLPAQRRAILKQLHDAIRSAAPELEPHMISGMLGYGHYLYRNTTGRQVEWCIVALASLKQYVSLYLYACSSSGYLAEQNADRLGKVSVGKSCIRFKKLEDLNLPVALELVKKASLWAVESGYCAKR